MLTLRRREFIALLGGAAAPFASAVVQAQDVGVPRVGVILQGGLWYAVIDGLRQGLKQLGLVEGKHFALEIRDAQGDLKKVEEAARSLERQNVYLIYSVATSVTLAAKRATQTVPIVFFAGANPVAVDLVETIPRPGNRLTGVYARTLELTGKRLELLREIAPGVRRVVTFYYPGNRVADDAAAEARNASRHLGLELLERHVASVEQLKDALRQFKAGEADAYFAVSDAMIDTQTSAIIDMALSRKLPTMFYQPSAVEEGGLAAYSWDLTEIGRISARHVQRVLGGTRPADLPVEGIDRFVFVINLNTAKHIGITVPDVILFRADKVIE